MGIPNIRYIFLRDRMLMTRFGLACGSFLWAVQLIMSALLTGPTPLGLCLNSMLDYVVNERVFSVVAAGLFLLQSFVAFYTLFTGVRNKATLMGDAFLGCLLWTSATVGSTYLHWYSATFLGTGDHFYMVAVSGEVVMMFYAWWHMVRF